MPDQNTPQALQQTLKSIIEEMQAIQRQISSGSQPASMHELDALSDLGRQYADVVVRLHIA